MQSNTAASRRFLEPPISYLQAAAPGWWLQKLGRRVGNGTVLVARLPVADTSLEIASARAAVAGESSTRLPGISRSRYIPAAEYAILS
jgi:hypothetical protein